MQQGELSQVEKKRHTTALENAGKGIKRRLYQTKRLHKQKKGCRRKGAVQP